MKIKPNWEEYIHSIRKREIDIIFSCIPNKSFKNGLEIGAGDGFQSILLSQYVNNLICTDINDKRLKISGIDGISFKVCDAELIDKFFKPNSFDFIFSSNLLEHVRDREIVLKKTYKLLNDNGVCINVVPNLFIKICYLGLFYPNTAVEIFESVTKNGHLVENFSYLFNKFLKETSNEKKRLKEKNLYNNLKSKKKVHLRNFFWPLPHGEYDSHFDELVAYRKSAWLRLIEGQGFEMINIIKMLPVSGYGLGADKIRALLEKVRLGSSYAFVAKKKGKPSKFQKYWGKKI